MYRQLLQIELIKRENASNWEFSIFAKITTSYQTNICTQILEVSIKDDMTSLRFILVGDSIFEQICNRNAKIL